jgi:hypothetical protein
MDTVEELTLERQKTACLEQENSRLFSTLEKKDSQLEKKDIQLEKLKNEILYLRRVLFGRSSERYIVSVYKVCCFENRFVGGPPKHYFYAHKL